MATRRSRATSDLGAVILGLVARSTGTGYDVMRRMERPVGYFWSAQHSQIYGELARLQEAGFLAGHDIDAAGPRQSRSWTVTETGWEALREWVRNPGPSIRRPRSRLGVRAFSMWAVTPDEIRELARSVRDEYEARLAELMDERDKVPKTDSTTDPQFGNAAVVQLGIVQTEAVLKWCDWVDAQLTSDQPG